MMAAHSNEHGDNDSQSFNTDQLTALRTDPQKAQRELVTGSENCFPCLPQRTTRTTDDTRGPRTSASAGRDGAENRKDEKE